MEIFHTTSYVVPISSDPIYNGAIAISGGIIVDTGEYQYLYNTYKDQNPSIYHTDNIILPSFINTHTHLEYAGDGLPPPLRDGESFFDWIMKLNKISRGWDTTRIENNIRHSLDILSKNGIGLIGDNGFSGIATKIITAHSIYSVYFQEYFGLDNDAIIPDKLSGLNKDQSHKLGVSPHSLYTANTALWSNLANTYPDMVFSSHIAESRDEIELYRDGHNDNIERFYIFVMPQMEYKHPYPLNLTPYSILEKEGVLDKLSNRIIAVHNVNMNDNDIEIAKRHDITLCLCPLSNKYLNNGTAPADKLYDNGLNLTLGTDSLSSNWDLDMLAEMREIRRYSSIPPKYILKMATINGAKALRFDSVTGTLKKGKSFDAIELKTDVISNIDKSALYDKIISTDKSDIKVRYHMGNEVYKA